MEQAVIIKGVIMQIAEIKTYLKKNKITYEELSSKSGIPLGTLKNIFSKCATNPRLDTMQAIEEALGLSKPLEWTEEDKALGVGRHSTNLSEREWKWLELGSELLRLKGEDYYKTFVTMIEAIISQKT